MTNRSTRRRHGNDSVAMRGPLQRPSRRVIHSRLRRRPYQGVPLSGFTVESTRALALLEMKSCVNCLVNCRYAKPLLDFALHILFLNEKNGR